MKMKKPHLKALFVLSLSCLMPFVFLNKTKDLLDMFLLLVSIIIPFQITTYGLLVGIIDADSLGNIKKINASALDVLSEIFNEFSSDTRLIVLFGILYFLATFIVKQDLAEGREPWTQIISGVAFFSIFSIFSIVIESINVILRVGKSKIDIAKILKSSATSRDATR